MQRICNSLAAAGYSVLLIGYKKTNSPLLHMEKFEQKRINTIFKTGKLFYTEYNIRLFFFLLFKKAECLCAIDLDTIIPCFFVSKIKGTKRVYDAHEFFSQLDEVVSRPAIYKFWHWVERKMIPRFKNGYTVCQSLADEFNKQYKADYEVIRNTPLISTLSESVKNEKVILYQGAVNKGRGLEKLITAMQNIKATLWICGDGNFMTEIKAAINNFGVSEKVILWGMMDPTELRKKTEQAYIAVNPFEKNGLNQYLSLSNKFFDYIHCALPQITMNYPEYRSINQEFEVSILIDDLEPKTIAIAINSLLADKILYNKLKENCLIARENLNWQSEEKKLLTFYNNLFNGK